MKDVKPNMVIFLSVLIVLFLLFFPACMFYRIAICFDMSGKQEKSRQVVHATYRFTGLAISQNVRLLGCECKTCIKL